jgi:NADPH:quinone reductase-like Zn-dependent oxidoreductase
VQFARRHGAKVIGTARGPAAKRFVSKLGADAAIDIVSGEVAEEVRAFAPAGIDAVLALAGGEALQKLLTLVRPGGRVAYPEGVEPEPKGSRKVKWVSYDGQAGPREFARLNRAVEETRLRVPIAAVYPLEKAAQAHQRLEQGQVLGRIALQIRKGVK